MTAAIALLFSVALTSFLLTHLLRPRSGVDFVLTGVVVNATLIFELGYVASSLNQLRSPLCWLTLSLLPLAAILIVLIRKGEARTLGLALWQTSRCTPATPRCCHAFSL